MEEVYGVEGRNTTENKAKLKDQGTKKKQYESRRKHKTKEQEDAQKLYGYVDI